MLYQATTATKKILALKKRIRAVQGGTAASKTISILLWLIDQAQSRPGLLISVVSETMPHIRRGAMRDFENIMRSHNYWQEPAWNASNSIYTFPNNSKIEFFSADTPDKVRGPRRDILFINEANNVPYMAYDQLEVRTKEVIWLDWNPTNEFWFYTELLPNRDKDIDHIILTYKDNEALDEKIVSSIEARKHNKNWWQVYGQGQLGEVEGRIYTGWAIIDEIPQEARLERRGLDFGFSNDPAALVDIYWYNGGYIFDERLYQTGMFNKDIADFIKNLEQPQVLIKADSAEPKSVAELKTYGLNVLAADKGADSVRHGIEHVQSQKCSITKRSLNLIKEYRNYMWETDKDGRQLTVPIDDFNHALDAIRYGLEKHKEKKKPRATVWVGGDEVTGFGRRRIVQQDPFGI